MRKKFDWTPKRIAMLGKFVDRVVAKKLGCTAQVVYGKRRELGIEPRRTGFNWTPQCIAMLGKVVDRVVAKKLGCTRAAVQLKRRELGIESCRKARGRLRTNKKNLTG